MKRCACISWILVGVSIHYRYIPRRSRVGMILICASIPPSLPRRRESSGAVAPGMWLHLDCDQKALARTGSPACAEDDEFGGGGRMENFGGT